jgi:hypothetical protein
MPPAAFPPWQPLQVIAAEQSCALSNYACLRIFVRIMKIALRRAVHEIG